MRRDGESPEATATQQWEPLRFGQRVIPSGVRGGRNGQFSLRESSLEADQRMCIFSAWMGSAKFYLSK